MLFFVCFLGGLFLVTTGSLNMRSNTFGIVLMSTGSVVVLFCLIPTLQFMNYRVGAICYPANEQYFLHRETPEEVGMYDKVKLVPKDDGNIIDGLFDVYAYYDIEVVTQGTGYITIDNVDDIVLSVQSGHYAYYPEDDLLFKISSGDYNKLNSGGLEGVSFEYNKLETHMVSYYDGNHEMHSAVIR